MNELTVSQIYKTLVFVESNLEHVIIVVELQIDDLAVPLLGSFFKYRFKFFSIHNLRSITKIGGLSRSPISYTAQI